MPVTNLRPANKKSNSKKKILIRVFSKISKILWNDWPFYYYVVGVILIGELWCFVDNESNH